MAETSHFNALVVDDDALVREIHSARLKSFGFKVAVAANGQEAVDLFSAGANFDFVFIDREMPVLDGIQATKELRAMGVTSKIIGVTSCSSEVEKEEFMEAGLDAFYPKPLIPSNISDLLEKLNDGN